MHFLNLFDRTLTQAQTVVINTGLSFVPTMSSDTFSWIKDLNIFTIHYLNKRLKKNV